jgi:hypothetical protein
MKVKRFNKQLVLNKKTTLIHRVKKWFFCKSWYINDSGVY